MSVDRHAGTNRDTIAGQARQISRWIQNAKFDGDTDRAISRLMENADKWIDPNQSASANYQAFKREYGLRTQSDREHLIKSASGRERQRAADTLRENIDAIDAGELPELVQDIREEYGEAFVAETLESARADDTLGGAPDPNEHNPSATAHANRMSATADTLEITHTPEPADTGESEPATAQASLADAAPASGAASIHPADDGRPSPGRTPAPASTPDAPASPGFTGILVRIGAPVKLLLVVLYVLLTAPVDATDPEVTAA